MSETIAKIRAQYPQYKDVSDADIADAMHRKFYSDVPREEFNKRIGFALPQEPTQAAISSIVNPMGDGPGGETVRANAAGNTRSKMPLPSIQSAYRVAQERGDRPEQRAMADAYVEAEKRASPVTMGISDRVRSVARGIPFAGEYLDEATALTSAPFDGKRREEVRDYQRARDRGFDASAPYQSMAGKAVGGIGGTIAALPAAGAVAGGNLLLGVGAKTVPGAIGRGILAGGLQGGAAGYGRADETQDAATMAAQDAAIGASLGGIIPAGMALGKKGFDMVAARAAPDDALSSVPAKARDWLVKTVGDRAALQKMQTDAAALGPNGMLADVSPEMLGIAQGAAARPGSRASVVEALTARDKGKNVRIGSAMNDTLGPVVEPSAIKSGIKEGMDDVGERYGDVMRQNGQPVDTSSIAKNLDNLVQNLRGPAQKAMREVRDMLNIPGKKELDPNPNALFQTRQAIDGLMANEANPKVIRELTMARQAIDDQLSSAVPGIKQVDGQFEELARQKGAVDDGARLFRTGPEAARPNDVATALKTAIEPAGTMVGPSGEMLRLTQGARAELDRIVGSNANDVAALRNMLKGEGDWNRQKLASIFGEDKAKRILGVLDNETTMENTYRQVVGGSQTGVKQGFNEFLKEAAGGVKVPVEGSAVGFALRGGQNLLQKITGNNNEAKASQFAEALASLPIKSGSEALAVVDALMKRAAKAKNSENFNDLIGRIGAGTGRADDTNLAKAAIIASIMGRDYVRQSNQKEAPRR